MKLLFSLVDQVHHFKVTGEIEAQDLMVLRGGLFQFLESDPVFTVLDLSQATLKTPQAEFHRVLSEIKSLVSSKNLNFTIAETSEQALNARNSVLQSALLQKVEILNAKLELRMQMRKDAENLVAENLKLRNLFLIQSQKLKSLKTETPTLLSPLVEKLWSGK